MKRVIIDHTKVTDTILNLILEEYPDGYTDRDVLKFKNHKGQLVEALEIKLDNDIYLVKVGTNLDKAIVAFSDEDSNDNTTSEEDLEVNENLIEKEE